MQPSPSTPQQTAPSPSKPARHNSRPGDSQSGTTRGYETPGSDRKQDDGAGSRSGTIKSAKRKKPRHRKRRHRRQSFLGGAEDPHPAASHASIPDAENSGMMAEDQTKPQAALPFYKLGRGLSSTSLESEALLDHRNQPPMRPRRDSRLAQSYRPGSSSTPFRPIDSGSRTLPSGARVEANSDGEEVNDRTPLMPPPSGHSPSLPRYGSDFRSSPLSFPQRRPVSSRSSSSRCSPRAIPSPKFPEPDHDYDINNPPSMPTSPKLGPEMNYDDAVVTGAEFDFSLAKSIDNRMEQLARTHDLLIDVDGASNRPAQSRGSSPTSPQIMPQERLRRRTTFPAEEDVCFPTEVVSELAEEDAQRTAKEGYRRRRRLREWPDLSVLEDWSRQEKEERSGAYRAKKISEPMLVEGRLRPQYRLWRREEDEAPYRFTYFNEEFQSTIHAQTISELCQPGGSFRELFIPDPPELEVSSDEDDTESVHQQGEDTTGFHNHGHHASGNEARVTSPNGNLHGGVGHTAYNHNHQGLSNNQRRQPRTSIISEAVSEARTPVDASPPRKPGQPKPKRYGPRPTFWLDVLSPTDAEMRVLAKAFGIHALTTEDIMMQEAREKVELFRNYYFVNYRTFEQDPNSENYLEPVNMYVVVFREGVLSFHFSQTPHPANVRRRIRQLMDYLILSSDWISYALIDDITDVFGPLIQAIEDEVDEIDEKIMQMHADERGMGPNKEGDNESVTTSLAPGEMLRRVGVCRKKVMGMYRLLSNKADVVKGFAKRCNEQWEVAPKSEIGLYLGDIQDHIMTMTSSLTYYETLLSRAHSNYLAQINILMNERQEQTADVLGKLTVLGTIVLPLNIICGMWGMNVKVPGQDIDSLSWFWSITAGLVLFAIASFYIAKRVYKIV
ncbi:cora-domain-containing protein [Aspergillus ibericus CBS 121593]|uniref:Cora-domain-containing protein n=1 Tax=Aspergillus ibericus CBS 121593 TaxID=1448316 RepID=A0A395H2X2_9EURO|nr:cora-domain-containing protein [Aspergillus ibericus CBS 121593]RAL02237.1 cora-domain-containing protein [Aspergillus ibericus CBS 121593]